MARTKKSARKSNNKKRARDETDILETPQAKRQARSNPSSAPQPDYDASIALKDPSLLADEFAKAVRRHNASSTLLELDPLYIPTMAFKDTTDFHLPHIATELPKFIEKFTEGGKEELSQCTGFATPHTIMLTSSGIRTADLVRELRVYNSGESKVAKFFAKHMKLADNIAFLQKSRVGVVVGTPKRLKELIEQHAVKLDGLKRVVIDASYRDEKKRTIFDMAEIFEPVLGLLNYSGIKSRFEAGADGQKIAEILVF